MCTCISKREINGRFSLVSFGKESLNKDFGHFSMMMTAMVMMVLVKMVMIFVIKMIVAKLY